MAVSRNSGHSEKGIFLETLVDRLTRYDLLLAAIPLVFGVAALAGTLTPVPFHYSAAGAGACCSLFVLDGVYFHPPIQRDEPRDGTQN